MNYEVRRLTHDDAAAFRECRLEGLQDSPAAFGSSYEEEVGRTVDQIAERFRTAWSIPNNAVFGAYGNNQLLGLVGIYNEGRVKMAHVMTLWGMYVRPAYRGHGIGRKLIDAALAHARTLGTVERVSLVVESNNEPAKRLYSSLGFQRWGTQPAALKIGDQYFNDDHMSLKL